MNEATCQHCHLPHQGQNGYYFCTYGCSLAHRFARFNKTKQIFFLVLAFVLSITQFLLPRLFGYLGGFSHTSILYTNFALAALLFFILGFPYIRFVMSSIIQRRQYTPDTLIMLAVIIDFVYSTYITFLAPSFVLENHYSPFYFADLALVSAVIISTWEGRLREKAYDDINIFKKIMYTGEVIKVLKNQENTVGIADVVVGDVIRVNPGQVIPLDGIIESGATSVDESPITSEPTIRFKQKGDMVTGSSINRDSTIFIRVETEALQHKFPSIIRLIHDAILSHSRFQARLEKVLPWVIALVILVALGTCLMIGKTNPVHAVQSLLSVIVVTTFSSFVYMIPLVVVLAIGKLALSGILLGSSRFFSSLSRLSSLFFDKTGTLTRGEFVYSKYYQEVGVNQGTLLSTIFSLERQSDHPLARSMPTHPWYNEMHKHDVKNFETHPGLGICGKVCEPGKPERFAVVGNLRFLKRHQMQVSREMKTKLDELESMGETVILCGWDRQVRGLMSFADTLSTDVKPLMEALEKLKVEPIMITGDHEEMISNLTYAHGLKQVYTRCLPDEKVNKIKAKKEGGKLVGMVGNVRDDSHVYQASDVSLVLGASTDFTPQGAQVVLYGKNLLKITNLIRYARVVDGTLRVGYTLGITASVLGLGLAALGLLPPMVALFSMILTRFIFATLPLRLKETKFS
ncbi:HAD-IC family P-type ATPase [bacterium]|nr:HAD-IC family P-type ATPase [bacterium]